MPRRRAKKLKFSRIEEGDWGEENIHANALSFLYSGLEQHSMWLGKEMGWVEVSKASTEGFKRDLPLENNKKITDWTTAAVVGATKNPDQMNSESKFERKASPT